MNKQRYIIEAKQRLLEGIGTPEQSEFIVDDFQREAVESVLDGHDTLVVAPTGSGKTYIALQSIEATIGCNQRAVYTTPLKALSNTKYTEMKAKFEPMYKVGLLTGDRKIDTNADLVIATTEIYRNELYRGEGRYSLVVLDEVHFIADEQRGPVWEESIILTPPTSTLLMLSATISNATEIAAWLAEVRGRQCHIVIKQDRPVALRHGFLHPTLGALPLTDEKGHILKEISQYYGTAGVDESGMKLRGGRFERNRGGRESSRRRGRK